jgi:hypothetical protein
MTVTLSGPSQVFFGANALQAFQNNSPVAFSGKDTVSIRFGNEEIKDEEAKNGETKVEALSVTERFSNLVAELLAEASEWVEKATGGLFQHNSPVLEDISIPIVWMPETAVS